MGCYTFLAGFQLLARLCYTFLMYILAVTFSFSSRYTSCLSVPLSFRSLQALHKRFNFYAFYDVDEKEGGHSLSLDDYGCDRDVQEHGAWVLLVASPV